MDEDAPEDKRHTVLVHEASRAGLPRLRPYFAEVWERRPFIWHLARSKMKGSHYDTFFGQAWLLLDPLFLAGVYFLLRSVVRPMGSADERTMLVAHLIGAIFMFQYGSSIALTGARSILSNQRLVLNAAFPRLVLPLSVLTEQVLRLGLMMAVYLTLHIAILDLPVGTSLAILPLPLLNITTFSLGLGLLLAPLTVFYRDIGGLLPYFSRCWLYSSPVLFRTTEIPESLRTYLQYNPYYPSFESTEFIFRGEWPPTDGLVTGAIVGFAMLIVGLVVFLRRENELAIRI